MRILSLFVILAALVGGFIGTPDSQAGVVPTAVSQEFVMHASVDHVDQTTTLALENGPAHGVGVVQFTIKTHDNGQTQVRHTESWFLLDGDGGTSVTVPLVNITPTSDTTYEVRAFYVDTTVPEMPVVQSDTYWVINALPVSDPSQILDLDPEAWFRINRTIAEHRGTSVLNILNPSSSAVTLTAPTLSTHAFTPDNPSSPTCPDLAGSGTWFAATCFSSGPAGVFTVN